jgi:hypothetical protein
MARLQILELPEGADDDRPPFVLVVDQVSADEPAFDALRRDLGDHGDLLVRIGARAVLVFEETIDIPANEITLTEAAEGNVVRLRVEPDLTGFREQVMAEVARAQADARAGLQ